MFDGIFNDNEYDYTKLASWCIKRSYLNSNGFLIENNIKLSCNLHSAIANTHFSINKSFYRKYEGVKNHNGFRAINTAKCCMNLFVLLNIEKNDLHSKTHLWWPPAWQQRGDIFLAACGIWPFCGMTSWLLVSASEKRKEWEKKIKVKNQVR